MDNSTINNLNKFSKKNTFPSDVSPYKLLNYIKTICISCNDSILLQRKAYLKLYEVAELIEPQNGWQRIKIIEPPNQFTKEPLEIKISFIDENSDFVWVHVIATSNRNFYVRDHSKEPTVVFLK